MKPPLFTCFYTLGTLYEDEAARLRRSLDTLGLDHDLRGVPSRGEWMKNAAMTAEHVCAVLADYPDRPVVQLDADAVVWKRPHLFDELYRRADVAVHYRRGTEMLNGTIYFAPTSEARMVAGEYLALIRSCPGCTNEQTMLAKAIEELSGKFRLCRLPPGYCFIKDLMTNDLAEGEEVVIEHLQASRESTKSPLLPSRRKRLEEIGG